MTRSSSASATSKRRADACKFDLPDALYDRTKVAFCQAPGAAAEGGNTDPPEVRLAVKTVTLQAPTVSVGVPVHNAERFLAGALEALLAQTFEDLEIVISDNGSTDTTEQICREFVARDGRVRYVRHDLNRGSAFNFSYLVGATSGAYFKWAAADDLVASTFVERCVETFEHSPERVCLVYPRTRIIDENGDAVRDHRDGLDLREPTPHERLRTHIRNIVMGNVMYGLIRRSALEQTRLVGSFPSSDYVLLAELALLGEFREVDEPLFLRREHPAMSRIANRSAAAVAEFHEPGSGRGHLGTEKYVREFWRLFREYLRSINSLPLTRTERLRCNFVFFREWLWRYGARLLSELFRREYTGSWNPFSGPAAGGT